MLNQQMSPHEDDHAAQHNTHTYTHTTTSHEKNIQFFFLSWARLPSGQIEKESCMAWKTRLEEVTDTQRGSVEEVFQI